MPTRITPVSDVAIHRRSTTVSVESAVTAEY
jgi:hypothetical protein